jgi:hypothetical protein
LKTLFVDEQARWAAILVNAEIADWDDPVSDEGIGLFF